MKDIIEALHSLRPGAEWVLRGDTYKDLEWLDKIQSLPTREEIEAEILILKEKWERLQYQRDRTALYPSLADFADAYYWMQKGDQSKMDAYITKCDEVKSKYPKPEVN